MKPRITIVVELLSPAGIQSAADLAQVDPAQIASMGVVLDTEAIEGELSVPKLELTFDHRRNQIIDLIEFARAAQPDGTTVELRYRGRSESFTL